MIKLADIHAARGRLKGGVVLTPCKRSHAFEDLIPAGFKYVEGSARLDGAPIDDPSGHRPLSFTIGLLPALVDSNGN
ncbi:MAG: hypothetical protein ACWGSQ_03675, partial [Longimicrobiales bacterium]